MISNNQYPRITKEQILGMPSDSSWMKKIFMMCLENQKKSNAKVKVGCVVEAMEYRKDSTPIFDFHGCNIHVSDSFGDTHAERMAIDFALKEKCYPIAVFVTSMSFKENVILCGSCRHYISEINEDCLIIIFNPDGSIKEISAIKDVYPNHKDVTKKNKMFYEYCAGLSDIKKGN